MTKSPTRPWKVSLQTTPADTDNSLVSLYDLFYNKANDELWINSTDPQAGCALEHDIICLNSAMLKSDNSIDQKASATMESSVWWKYGIDISIPLFDARAKRKEVACEAMVKSTNIRVFERNKFVIYDKESALEPESTDVFTARGVMANGGTLSWDSYLPPSISTFNPGGDNSADILLSAPDKAFKSTLVTRDGFSAYNRIMVNPYSWFAVCLVIKATGMSPGNLLGNSQNYMTAAPSNLTAFGSYANFWAEKDTPGDYIATAVNLGANASDKASFNASTKDGTRWKTLLKNTFVWVRAPFFADYVKPDDFEQSLTADSKVVHNELMLSGAGDFKKYDMFSTSSAYSPVGNDGGDKSFAHPGLGVDNGEKNGDALKLLGMSELRMPYIPKTSPTVDIYTSKLLDKDEYLRGLKPSNDNRDETNYSSRIYVPDGKAQIEDFLENEVSGNDMVVRGLPMAAINRTNSKTESSSMESLVPPNWFDPENRLSDEYYRDMTKFPTVVPKDGNLYVDGRIIGPTIDEIWIMLKKLTGGRLSDINSSKRALNLDMGIPVGTGVHENNTDTTMTEVPDSEFNFNLTDTNGDSVRKYGDPIDFQYSPESNSNNLSMDLYNQKLNITKFVNQNDKITYPVYNSLKLLSDSIVAHTTDGEHTINGNKAEENIETNRKITEFTAWNDVTLDKDTVNDKSNVVKDNESVETGFWAPRSAPYSLRELEAMIMGNKYNIITQARFVKENFAVTGGLGKITGGKENDMSNFTSGSLYQMHKNYNFDVANPNTFYNNAGTDTGFVDGNAVVGAKAVIDDVDWRNADQRAAGHIRYVENYGTSNALSTDPEQYSSSDVYLSAYGDWRYVSDHNRIPILRGEWI